MERVFGRKKIMSGNEKNSGTFTVNNQGDRIFDLIHPLNRHLLQLVGCCYCSLIWRDLMAVLFLTESVVELAGLKMLLTRNLFVSVAVEMSRLTCRGVVGFFLSDLLLIFPINYSYSGRFARCCRSFPEVKVKHPILCG